MNNELTLWNHTAIEATPMQTVFNWDETFAETKKLVEEDAELTATIDDAMVKRFHGRVKIGFNLMALQKEHSRKGGGIGDFTTVELPKLGIDERFARRCISVARLLENSNRTSLSGSDLFDLPMPMDTWYKLASPSGQTVVKQLESGEIKPTQEEIKKALEEEKAKAAAEKQRAEQLKQELEAEQKAHSLFKQEVESNEQAYTALVQSLEKQLEEKPEPEKVIEYQDTLETAAKVATLEEQIKALQNKSDITPEKQQELDNLQTQLDFYEKQNKALADKNKQLSEESRRSFTENIASVGRLRIRQEWQFATTEVQASLRKFHTKVPSEIDRQSFEGEEHTRTYQTIEVLEQTIAFLRGTLPQATSSIVDEPQDPIALIEASKQQSSTTTFSDNWESLATRTKPEDYWKLFEQYRQFVKNLANDTLWWIAPDSGIMDMEMSKEEHIHYTGQMLRNGQEFNEPYRIGCAIECMKRTLAYLN